MALFVRLFIFCALIKLATKGQLKLGVNFHVAEVCFAKRENEAGDADGGLFKKLLSVFYATRSGLCYRDLRMCLG